MAEWADVDDSVEVVLLQIELQDRVLDGGELEANYLMLMSSITTSVSRERTFQVNHLRGLPQNALATAAPMILACCPPPHWQVHCPGAGIAAAS